MCKTASYVRECGSKDLYFSLALVHKDERLCLLPLLRRFYMLLRSRTLCLMWKASPLTAPISEDLS